MQSHSFWGLHQQFTEAVSVRDDPEKENQQGIYMKRFIARNWLTPLWGQARQVRNLRGQRSGEAAGPLRREPSLSPALKAFPRLNQAPADYLG